MWALTVLEIFSILQVTRDQRAKNYQNANSRRLTELFLVCYLIHVKFLISMA